MNELKYTKEDIERMESEVRHLERTICEAKAAIRNAEVAADEEHFRAELPGKVHVIRRDAQILRVQYISDISVDRRYDGVKELHLYGSEFVVSPGGCWGLGSDRGVCSAGMSMTMEKCRETITLDGDSLPPNIGTDLESCPEPDMFREYILPIDALYGANSVISKWIASTVDNIKVSIDESVEHGLATYKRKLRESRRNSEGRP